MKIKLSLDNIDDILSEKLSEERKARAKTLFLKHLSISMHRYYGGKMQTLPKAGVYGFNWFNVWYTPGVSLVSTSIRDNEEFSFELSNRGNLVAIVSDSTRVLGDGDCGPAGGLGVMEGKAFLMKYLGGVDAVALCMNSRGRDGRPDPDKIISFVEMLEPSFGAVNLEDISQPNCYKVLDSLRESCAIPVWHDDAQGTASVTLAGLINALKLVDKRIQDAKIVLLGAGASNSTIARFILRAGGSGENLVVFDSKGGLHRDRKDVELDTRFYRKWELCLGTNPRRINDIPEAMKGADVLIALSEPGPDTVKSDWIRLMGKKPVVFVCANPVPEIYPYAAKEAGAYIVATGRGDFPNQVNNSVGFPGILKGSLLARARKVSDDMAIAASHSLARFAENRGIDPENIIATMDETDVFPYEAADVAEQAAKEGLARTSISWDAVFESTKKGILEARGSIDMLMKEGFVKEPPAELIEEALSFCLAEVNR